MNNRTLEILQAPTKSNKMEGRKDGWYFLCVGGDFEFGPILTPEIYKLQDEGLIHAIQGVDRWLTTDAAWIELQKRGMVLDSVAYLNNRNVSSDRRMVERVT